MTTKSSGKQSSTLGPTIGVLLIVVGSIFLVSEYLDFGISGEAWPLFIIIPGSCMILLGLAGDSLISRRLTNFGAVVAAVGTTLFYQETFDHYESWAYAWSFVMLIAVGLSQILYGSLKGHPDMVDGGRKLAIIGAFIFGIGLIFFEFVIGIGNFGFSFPTFDGYLIPVLLIGLGVFMLIRGQLTKGSSAQDDYDEPVKQKF